MLYTFLMKARWYLFAASILLIFIYLPYLNEPFFIIDDFSLVGIPQLAECSFSSLYQRFLVMGYHIDYYPLRDLSYLADNCISSTNAAGTNGIVSRLHNIFLFIATVFVLFEIFLKLKINKENALWISLLIFLNPFFNENYLWISGRKDLLSLFFLTLSVYAYLNAQESKKYTTWSTSLFFYILSLLSKASFVLLPSVLLVFNLVQKSKDKKNIVFLSLASAIGISWALFQSFFYSNINNMSLNYPYLYRLKASLQSHLRLRFPTWLLLSSRP